MFISTCPVIKCFQSYLLDLYLDDLPTMSLKSLALDRLVLSPSKECLVSGNYPVISQEALGLLNLGVGVWSSLWGTN